MNEFKSPSQKPHQKKVLNILSNIFKKYTLLVQTYKLDMNEKLPTIKFQLEAIKESYYQNHSSSTAIDTVLSSIHFLELMDSFLLKILNKLTLLQIENSFEEVSDLNLLIREFYQFIDIFKEPKRSFDSLKKQDILKQEYELVKWFGKLRSLLTHNRTSFDSKYSLIDFLNYGIRKELYEKVIFDESILKETSQNINFNKNIFVSKSNIMEYLTIYSNNQLNKIDLFSIFWLTNLNSKKDDINVLNIQQFKIIWFKDSPIKIFNIIFEMLRLLNIVLECLLY